MLAAESLTAQTSIMPMIPPRLILASSSPQRKRLLDEAGYQFDVVVPDGAVEECGICSTGGPAGLVTELALRKAADVAKSLADREQLDSPLLIVACDTVAECGGAVLGKPRDEEHARDMLYRLRGQHQRVFSGLCLWLLEREQLNATPQTHLAVTELRMDSISDDDVEEYLASGLWRGKAGAFGYQDRHGWLHVLQGSESNVIGLPMELFGEQLKQFGFTT